MRFIRKHPFLLSAILAAFALAGPRFAAAGTTNDRRPEVYLNFSTTQAPANLARIRLKVDGVDVTDKARLDPFSIRYSPDNDMTFGVHRVEAFVADIAGHSAVKTWSFEIVEGETAAAPALRWAGQTPENGAMAPLGQPATLEAEIANAGGVDLTGAKTVLRVKSTGDAGYKTIPDDEIEMLDGRLRWTSSELSEPGPWQAELKMAGGGWTSNILQLAFFVSGGSAAAGKEPIFKPRGKTFSLEPFEEETEADSMALTGYGPPDSKIELTVNDGQSWETVSDDAGRFSFPFVELEEGPNAFALAAAESEDGAFGSAQEFPNAVYRLSNFVDGRQELPYFEAYWPGGGGKNAPPGGFEITATVAGVSAFESNNWTAQAYLDDQPLALSIEADRNLAASVPADLGTPGSHNVLIELISPDGEVFPIEWGIFVDNPSAEEGPSD